MLRRKRWEYCCVLIALALTTGCRTGGGGGSKDSVPPTTPEQECQPGTQDNASDFKAELLKQGEWSKDGDRWKAGNPAAMIFKSIVLAQEKPDLLATPGQSPEDKWALFYDSALQFKNSELSLAPVGSSNTCP